MKLIDVAFVPFPEAVHGKMAGVATRNEQKHRYQILIDNLNPAEVQQKCLRHEYGHIMLGHLEEPEPEKAMENYRMGLMRINSRERYERFLHAGFPVLLRDENRGPEETLALAETLFGL